eukprot:TRINITY_DN41563_c0_g1_i1.p1 TRINITY_DN41563_c0_g1~~TRINITY_DN41563_c0_g1_i1.p1  ORF type:complete len:964 (+),score=192.40 TRINITY_DN41563_c0_g1_i1:146-3037(+)
MARPLRQKTGPGTSSERRAAAVAFARCNASPHQRRLLQAGEAICGAAGRGGKVAPGAPKKVLGGAAAARIAVVPPDLLKELSRPPALPSADSLMTNKTPSKEMVRAGNTQEVVTAALIGTLSEEDAGPPPAPLQRMVSCCTQTPSAATQQALPLLAPAPAAAPAAAALDTQRPPPLSSAMSPMGGSPAPATQAAAAAALPGETPKVQARGGDPFRNENDAAERERERRRVQAQMLAEQIEEQKRRKEEEKRKRQEEERMYNEKLERERKQLEAEEAAREARDKERAAALAAASGLPTPVAVSVDAASRVEDKKGDKREEAEQQQQPSPDAAATGMDRSLGRSLRRRRRPKPDDSSFRGTGSRISQTVWGATPMASYSPMAAQSETSLLSPDGKRRRRRRRSKDRHRATWDDDDSARDPDTRYTPTPWLSPQADLDVLSTVREASAELMKESTKRRTRRRDRDRDWERRTDRERYRSDPDKRSQERERDRSDKERYHSEDRSQRGVNRWVSSSSQDARGAPGDFSAISLSQEDSSLSLQALQQSSPHRRHAGNARRRSVSNEAETRALAGGEQVASKAAAVVADDGLRHQLNSLLKVCEQLLLDRAERERDRERELELLLKKHGIDIEAARREGPAVKGPSARPSPRQPRSGRAQSTPRLQTSEEAREPPRRSPRPSQKLALPNMPREGEPRRSPGREGEAKRSPGRQAAAPLSNRPSARNKEGKPLPSARSHLDYENIGRKAAERHAVHNGGSGAPGVFAGQVIYENPTHLVAEPVGDQRFAGPDALDTMVSAQDGGRDLSQGGQGRDPRLAQGRDLVRSRPVLSLDEPELELGIQVIHRHFKAAGPPSPFSTANVRGMAVRRVPATQQLMASPPPMSRGGLNLAQGHWPAFGRGPSNPSLEALQRPASIESVEDPTTPLNRGGPGQVPIGIRPSIQAQSAMLRELYPNGPLAAGAAGPTPLP